MKKRINSHGVISVFVALMLSAVLSLGTLVLEAGRYQVAKTQLSEADISAATSMIAAYDATLYERYGLLSIDTSKFKEGRCAEYLNFNSDLSPGYEGNRITKMYTIKSMELDGLYNLTYPAVLKRQVLSRAKYHVIPQNFALNVYNVDAFLTDLQSKCQFVKNKLEPIANGSAADGSRFDIEATFQLVMNKVQNGLKGQKTHDENCDVTLTSATASKLPSKTGTVTNTVPTEDLEIINNTSNDVTSVLGSGGAVLRPGSNEYTEVDAGYNPKDLSTIVTRLSDLNTNVVNVPKLAKEAAVACRDLASGFNSAINTLKGDKEGNLLLNSYISQYFSNRNNTVKGYNGPAKGSHISGRENQTFVSACTEYIFGGGVGEKDNQDAAYNYIFGIRMIYNLYNVLSGTIKLSDSSLPFNSNNKFVAAYYIVWAGFESRIDMALMLNYGAKVPLAKNRMILDINNISASGSKFISGSITDAMKQLGYYNGSTFSIPGAYPCSYMDSIAIALWMVPNSTKMFRVADLIQLEMRYKEQYLDGKAATFLMSEQNTYCRVKVVAKLNSILPVVSLGEGNSMANITFQSIKYAGY